MVNYEINTLHKNLKNYQTGDVIFVKGNRSSLLDILIRVFSGSWYVHTAILIQLNGLWFVIETKKSSAYAYQLVPLEWWLTRNKTDQLYLGKMPHTNSMIRSRIRTILMDCVESLRPYKLSWIYLAYILQNWFKAFKPNLSKLYNGEKPLICSTLIQEAWERTGVIEVTNYMTPGDLVDCIGGEHQLIPLNIADKNNDTTANPSYGSLTTA